MNISPKILWSEGATLRPQQFQQQDLYHEARLHRIAKAIHPHLWGVHAIAWDTDGLANKLLRAEAMSLIFPDGEIYEAPGTDALPAAVDLSKLPLSEDCFTFYAALPFFKGHGGNLAGVGGKQGGARFAHAERDTPDLFTEAMNADVAYLTKQVELLPQAAPRNAYVNFPVARLLRVARGGFEIDPAFMPPSLSIAAAAGLPWQLDKLMQKLKAKLDALYGDQREPSKDVVEVRSGDISSFWLLHTISTACACLTHYAECKDLHPERMFLELLGLAGGLMTSRKSMPSATCRATSTATRARDLPGST